MNDKPIKLSETGRAMLTLASAREDRLVPPPTLPVAAARQVVRSLLNTGAVEEIELPENEPQFFWRQGDDGKRLALQATPTGLAAIGEPTVVLPTLEAFTQAVIGFLAEEDCNASILEENEARVMVEDGRANGRAAAQVAGDILTWLSETEAEAEAAEAAAGAAEAVDHATALGTEAAGGDDQAAGAAQATQVTDAPSATPTAPTRVTLRQAAEAVLTAWADESNRGASLEAAIAALRQAIGTRLARTAATTPRQPREGTKQSKVLEMLRRPEGATVAQIAEAMGWAPHTVRGFFAGLRKRQGIIVVPSERVRQAGTEGAKGSFTIYRIAEVG